MALVAAALDRASGAVHPEVRGILAFVGAEWKLFSRPFTHQGAHVAWPTATVELVSSPGVYDAHARAATAAVLDGRFRPA